MIRYEIKKIFSKNSSKVVLIVLLVSLVISCYFAITNVIYMDEKGVSHTGISAVQSLRAEKQKWEGMVTEDVLQVVIEENAKVNEEYPLSQGDVVNNDIHYSKIQGFSDIRDLITQGFCDFREYNYYRIDTVSKDEVYKVYENRNINLTRWLNSEEAMDLFSEEEKAFLINQYRQMKTPLYYKNADGWKSVLKYAQMIIMLVMLIVAFLVSGIFSNEFGWKADAIFFSTRYGRDKGARSKMAAGFMVVTIIYWIIIALYSFIVLGCLGFSGGDCKIQMGYLYWKSFYNITYSQLYLLTIIAGYVGNLFCLLLSMLVSAKTHTAVLAATIPFIILFWPSFLPDINFLKEIMGLFPDQLLQINEIINRFNLYHVGGKIVGSIPIMMVIYPILSILLIPFIYGVYHKTEVR